MVLCKKCKNTLKKVICKGLCCTCYYANKRCHKTNWEQLLERNYVKNGTGILTGNNNLIFKLIL